jgi:hypothetical protein
MRSKMLTAAVPLIGLILFATFAALYVYHRDAYYQILGTMGSLPFRYPFLDWETIGAWAKCWQQGVNVYVTDPCDVLGSVADYSPLWLRASFIPTDALWTNIIGTTLDISFILSLVFVVRPVNWREVAIFVGVCCSVMVVYALERANVDVLIFIMIVVAGMLGIGSLISRMVAYTILLFAGLLKFYPLVGFMIALRERPRVFIGVCLISFFIVALFAYAYRDELVAMSRNIPLNSSASGSFGAINLPQGFAAAIDVFVPQLRHTPLFRWIQIAFVAGLSIPTVAHAFVLSRNHGLERSFSRLAEHDRMFLSLGSALIVGCFFTGQSIEYRGVYLIMVVAGLVALCRSADCVAVRIKLTRAILIIIFLMWQSILRHLLEQQGSVILGVFWLVRELLWWYQVSVLLAVLAIFIMQSRTFIAARQLRVIGVENSGG